MQKQLLHPGTKGATVKLEPKAVHSNDFEVTTVAAHRRHPLIAAGTSDGIVTVYFSPGLFGTSQTSDFREVKAGLMGSSQANNDFAETLFSSAVDSDLVAGIGSSRVKRVVRTDDNKVKPADVGGDSGEARITTIAFHPFLPVMTAADSGGRIVVWRIGIDDEGHTVIGCRQDLLRTLDESNMNVKQIWFSQKTTELYVLFSPKQEQISANDDEASYWSTTPGMRPSRPYGHDLGVWSAASRATKNTKQHLPADDPNRLTLSPTPGAQLGLDSVSDPSLCPGISAKLPTIRAFSLAHRSLPCRKERFSRKITKQISMRLRHLNSLQHRRAGLRINESVGMAVSSALRDSEWSSWIRKQWENFEGTVSDPFHGFMKHIAWENNLLPHAKAADEGAGQTMSTWQNVQILGQPQGGENCFLLLMGDRILRLEEIRTSIFDDSMVDGGAVYPSSPRAFVLGHTILTPPTGKGFGDVLVNFHDDSVLVLQQMQGISASPPRLNMQYMLLRYTRENIPSTVTTEDNSKEEDVSMSDLLLPKPEYICGMPATGPFGPMTPVSISDSPSGRFAVVQYEYSLLTPRGPSGRPIYAYYVIGPMFDYVNKSAAETPELCPRCKQVRHRGKDHWVMPRKDGIRMEGPYHARSVIALPHDRLFVVDAAEYHWNRMASVFVLNEIEHVLQTETKSRVSSTSNTEDKQEKNVSVTPSRRNLKQWVKQQENVTGGNKKREPDSSNTVNSPRNCPIRLLQLSLQLDHEVCQVYGTDDAAATKYLPTVDRLTASVDIPNVPDRSLCQVFRTPMTSSCGDVLIWYTMKGPYEKKMTCYLEHSVNASIELDIATSLPCRTQIFGLLPPLGESLVETLLPEDSSATTDAYNFDPFESEGPLVPHNSPPESNHLLRNAHKNPQYSFRLEDGEHVLNVTSVCSSSFHLQRWLDSTLSCIFPSDKGERYASIETILDLGMLPLTALTSKRVISFSSNLNVSQSFGLDFGTVSKEERDGQVFMPAHLSVVTTDAPTCYSSAVVSLSETSQSLSHIPDRVCSVGYAQGLPIVITASGKIHLLNAWPKGTSISSLQKRMIGSIPMDVLYPCLCMQQGQTLTFGALSHLSQEPEEIHIYTRPINFEETTLSHALHMYFHCTSCPNKIRELVDRYLLATLYGLSVSNQENISKSCHTQKNLQSTWGYSRGLIYLMEQLKLGRLFSHLFGPGLMDSAGKRLQCFPMKSFTEAFSRAHSNNEDDGETSGDEGSAMRAQTMAFSSAGEIDKEAQYILSETGQPRFGHLVPPWWAGEIVLTQGQQELHTSIASLEIARSRPILYGYVKLLLMNYTVDSPGIPNPLPDPLDPIVASLRGLVSLDLNVSADSIRPWVVTLACIPQAIAAWAIELVCEEGATTASAKKIEPVVSKYFEEISKYDPSIAKSLNAWLMSQGIRPRNLDIPEKLLDRMVFSGGLQPKGLPQINLKEKLTSVSLLECIRSDLSIEFADLTEEECRKFGFDTDRLTFCFNTLRSSYGSRTPQLLSTIAKKHQYHDKTGEEGAVTFDEMDEVMQKLGISNKPELQEDDTAIQGENDEEVNAATGLSPLGLKNEDKVIGYWRFEERADYINNMFGQKDDELDSRTLKVLNGVFVHDLSGKANAGFLVLNEDSEHTPTMVECEAPYDFGDPGKVREPRSLRVKMEKQGPNKAFWKINHPFVQHVKDQMTILKDTVSAGAAIPLGGVSHVNVGLRPFSKINCKFTLEFWYRWGPPIVPGDSEDEDETNTDETWKLNPSVLVQRLDTVPSNVLHPQWSLNVEQDGSFSFRNEVATADEKISPEMVKTEDGVIERGQWLHLAVVVNTEDALPEVQNSSSETTDVQTSLSSKANVKLYINGSKTNEGKVSCYHPIKAPEDAYAGYMVFGPKCVGDIAEARLWATERSETQIYDTQGFCLDMAEETKRKGLSVSIKPVSRKSKQNGDAEDDVTRGKSHSSPTKKLRGPRVGALKPPPRRTSMITPQRKKSSTLKKPDAMPTIHDVEHGEGQKDTPDTE